MYAKFSAILLCHPSGTADNISRYEIWCHNCINARSKYANHTIHYVKVEWLIQFYYPIVYWGISPSRSIEGIKCGSHTNINSGELPQKLPPPPAIAPPGLRIPAEAFLVTRSTAGISQKSKFYGRATVPVKMEIVLRGLLQMQWYLWHIRSWISLMHGSWFKSLLGNELLCWTIPCDGSIAR